MRFSRTVRRALPVVAAVAVAALAAGHAPEGVRAQSSAARTWDVQAGGDIESEFISTQTYFPQVLTINTGDTVRWGFAGFHTVSFMSGQPAPPLASPGPEAGTLKIGPGFLPINVTGPSATYSGSEVISSGTPEEGGDGPPTFSVTFTRSGTYTYLCLIHPGMEGTVTVAPAGAALPETPSEASARGTAEYESVVSEIRALTGMATAVQPATAPAPGRSAAHSALVGLAVASGASYMNFLPGDITVRRGDLVVWTMPDPFEIHTVTFLSGAEPPEFVEPRFGPGGPAAGPPELVVPANIAGPAGGSTFTGRGYMNSGVMTNGSSYALHFDAPAGSYQYICVVHPFMVGTVTVTEE